ncbi:nuclear protein localization protein 4 homolog, partial [Limulus polyphemus]|uniref:Nuclear protein localization protein 4 homolog n=1 Tax=Limulus polyphemus TaxID=6850 RepID=A0ABM1RYR4_LIMPO
MEIKFPQKNIIVLLLSISYVLFQSQVLICCQESTRDSVKLQPDERESLVDHIASELGLKKVGWIFTDLIAEDLQKGTVKYLRNATSYFLSAEECIMAGYFQNQHPNPCRLSPDGYFGSKIVTVCVT